MAAATISRADATGSTESVFYYEGDGWLKWMTGAGDGIRTRDIDLGKVALYQLSYSRLKWNLHFALNASNLSNPSYQASDFTHAFWSA